MTDRVLGRVRGARPGPLLLLVGGLHGNEPAGVDAARAVVERLAGREAALRGRVVALTGNRAALDRGVRHVDRDLNRMWLDAELAVPPGPEEPRERAEQRELLAAIEAELADGPHEGAALLDLHATSAAGPPFCILADTLRNRALAEATGLPVLLGLEEAVDGTLLAWFTDRGHVAVCVEGGRQGDPETAENQAAAALLATLALGMLGPEDLPEASALRTRLARARGGLPAFVEVVHRHRIPPGRRFDVEPDLASFRPVRRGTLLARQDGVEVRAPRSGLLLMPRYQGQGDDGFFLGRAVPRRWLRLSAALRRARAERVLPLLPGVRRDPERGSDLVVDPRVARLLATQVFHLLGYRRCRPEGGRLRFARRPEAPAGPGVPG